MALQLKKLFFFFFFLKYCFLFSGVLVQDKLVYYRALHCNTKSEVVSREAREAYATWYRVAKDSFRAINYKRGRRSDKSVCVPKLSALQHRCLRFLLLIKWIWLLWLIQYRFFWIGCKSSKSTNHKGIHTWIKNLQNQLSAWRKCLSNQTHSIFIFTCCCAALSCLYLIRCSPLPSPPREVFGRWRWSPLPWCLLSSSCCSVTIMTFSLLDCQQLAPPSPPVAL